jgi:tetratricopeptide (TPR) repeat protein
MAYAENCMVFLHPAHIRSAAFGLALLLAAPGLLRADLWDDVAPAIRAGDYTLALVHLQNAAAEHPDDYQVQRVLGRCLMELGRLADAEDHLRNAVRLRAESSAARFDLAQVLALRGNLHEAEQFLREILQLAPDSSYAARARQVLPGLSQLKETLLVREAIRRWDIYVRVAGEYDDNVPARSRHDPRGDTDSTRLTSSLRLAYRWPDQRLDPSWPTLEAGYSFYRSFHEDKAFREFDVMSHRGSLELYRQGQFFGRWAKAGVEGSAGTTELGDAPYSETAGVIAGATLQLFPAFVVTLGYGVQWKDFDDDTDFPEFFSRDGHDQEVLLDTYTYLFQNRLILGLGYGYLWNNVDGSQFELDQHRVRASATLSLPRAWRVHTAVTYATETYDAFTPDPKREDDAITAYASLSRPLWNEAWRAELNYTYHTSDSNQDFAEYDRAVYGIALSWSP